MKEFVIFRILSILTISPDRPDAMVNDMCVTINWIRFKTTPIHYDCVGRKSTRNLRGGDINSIFQICQISPFSAQFLSKTKEYQIYFDISIFHLILSWVHIWHLVDVWLFLGGKMLSSAEIPSLTLD